MSEYKIVYSGIDTLDFAVRGAFPNDVLETLRNAREEAEKTEKDQPIKLGKSDVSFLVKPHGKRGGYKYVLVDGPTGAIYSVKANTDLDEWNLFISIRASRLLTYGYEKTKVWIFEKLEKIGFRTLEFSVNRIDFAIDVKTNGFELEHSKLITPARAKVSSYLSNESDLDESGNQIRSVVRAGRFESITVGKMPNRQVIIYDKRRAAIDQRQPWWFDAWKVDREDPSVQIWRVEIRAGRDALAKKLLRRSFEACEAELPDFLKTALSEVRYTSRRDTSNVSRSLEHPLWSEVRKHAKNVLKKKEAPVLLERVLRIMRDQRRDIAIPQSFGNLINAMVLDGVNPIEISSSFPELAYRYAEEYLSSISEPKLRAKAEETQQRLSMFC
ncbi:hypothetical protein [Actibacterium pelagium]|uniref:Replication initiation factor n=1 Tax=Actibacterium pelagium TaxID=2029103 RepID=A0A917AD73_9RHOB|nr:hypothetical protein [Actibacterium pelagium]GGE43625.1 hypothetical protein GCM10011517_09140 [Actibacterium pelagium]